MLDRVLARLRRTWLDPFHISHSTIERALRRHAAMIRGRTLDIGCGEKPYRRLFPSAKPYWGTETSHTFVRRSGADVTALGEALPFADGIFEGIVCTEVLEHVPDPSAFLAEVFRVAAPGAVVLLTTPQTWGLHEEPYDFYRYTKYGLYHLFTRTGLQILDVSPTTGTLATVGQRLSSFCFYELGGRRRALKPVAAIASAAIQLLFYAGDAAFGHRGDTLDWVVLARKPV